MAEPVAFAEKPEPVKQQVDEVVCPDRKRPIVLAK
jgi:hypothetical protein